MKNENAKLITIFTEAALESKLIKDIEKLGATGYSVTNARGKGSRGTRAGSWEANSNIRIEIICSAKVADRITTSLRETYYENYAMVTYSSDVQVLRPEKFTS